MFSRKLQIRVRIEENNTHHPSVHHAVGLLKTFLTGRETLKNSYEVGWKMANKTDPYPSVRPSIRLSITMALNAWYSAAIRRFGTLFYCFPFNIYIFLFPSLFISFLSWFLLSVLLLKSRTLTFFEDILYY